MNTAIASPIHILRQHGKSFYWASWFLGRKKASNAARLYAFCRAVDDLTDKHTDSNFILTTLQLWQKQIRIGESTVNAVNDVLALARELDLDTSALTYLMDGLISDVTLVKVNDEKQLLQYAFLVAGTVGLMMCDLLGAKHPDAKKFAVDLGIAMQLTNILRDVAEDAAAGRQYIPQSWLTQDINFFDVSDETDVLAKPVFERLHMLAERYYKSGYAGLTYLPIRSRLAIGVAARLYQEIGLKAKRQAFSVLDQRIVVSPLHKCWLVLVSCVRFAKDLLWRSKQPLHDPALHDAIKPWVKN